MPRPFRKPRLLMLAASTAVVAGGVLAPTGAFAAAPAAPHAVVADARAAAADDHGGSDKGATLLVIIRTGDGKIRVWPDQGKDDAGELGQSHRPGRPAHRQGRHRRMTPARPCRASVPPPRPVAAPRCGAGVLGQSANVPKVARPVVR